MSQSAGVITTIDIAFSAVRLELRPGEWVLWDTRPHRLESLLNDRARLRDPTTAELREVPVSDLRGLPSLPPMEVDARMETARTTDPTRWASAEARESIIRTFLEGDGAIGIRILAAANALGVTPRTVRRLVARYRVSAQTTSLVPRLPGPQKIRRRLGVLREQVIAEAIETRYLVRPRTPMEEVYRLVVHRCREASVPAPARGSVIARVRALDERHVARRRLGSKDAQAVARSTPGELGAVDALELIQMDHTLADVIIVDSLHRRPIGRPWLSLAIDVATRSVLGGHVALEAPSALAVALCLEHACLPKDQSGLMYSDAPWPMFGLPRRILVDNGPEFHGQALVRGCSEYGITLSHRPVRQPHFGGHIERLIGTMMGRVHLLPGTTDASPEARSGYDSERTAVMTLSEFARWLCLEIAGRYHQEEHRMLGVSPAAAWAASMAKGVIPVVPADPERFLISFLPVIHRRLQRNGLYFERIRYWSDVLPTIAQPREKLLVRHDPRDLSHLYVMGKDKRYHTVPYANITHPPISLAELRFIYGLLRNQSRKHFDEIMLFTTYEQQRQLVAGATTTTKATRRREEAARRSKTESAGALVSSIDFGRDPVDLPTEIWESPP
jgi:putative transposase